MAGDLHGRPRAHAEDVQKRSKADASCAAYAGGADWNGFEVWQIVTAWSAACSAVPCPFVDGHAYHRQAPCPHCVCARVDWSRGVRQTRIACRVCVCSPCPRAEKQLACARAPVHAVCAGLCAVRGGLHALFIVKCSCRFMPLAFKGSAARWWQGRVSGDVLDRSSQHSECRRGANLPSVLAPQCVMQ